MVKESMSVALNVFSYTRSSLQMFLSTKCLSDQKPRIFYSNYCNDIFSLHKKKIWLKKNPKHVSLEWNSMMMTQTLQSSSATNSPDCMFVFTLKKRNWIFFFFYDGSGPKPVTSTVIHLPRRDSRFEQHASTLEGLPLRTEKHLSIKA